MGILTASTGPGESGASVDGGPAAGASTGNIDGGSAVTGQFPVSIIDGGTASG